MDETMVKIRQTYAKVQAERPAEHAPLPPWEALSEDMRAAIIAVFYAGRRDGMPEEAERAQEEGS